MNTLPLAKRAQILGLLVEGNSINATCRITGAAKATVLTPAMEAGIADHVWSLEEIAALVPEPEAKPRGPYKKRNSNQTTTKCRHRWGL